MSEDRRAAPGPEPLEGAAGAAVVATDGVEEEGSLPLLARLRARPSLRIPDDEVARPLPGAGASVRVGRGPGSADEPLPPAVTASRIITINSEPPDPEPTSAPDSGPTVHVIDDEALTVPQLAPAPSTPSTPDLLHEDEEEVDFDEDALTPAMPRVLPSGPDSERRSDSGEMAEVSPEDMVAVEPLAARPPAGLPPMRARAPSSPAPPRQTPLVPPPSGPSLLIVPPRVGSVAPQQTDSFGPRRKARLWWEDLFNDDYLRTMEKTTDEQLLCEVDFIEENLSVERGGAVLDLACGTGRHAIDLARRGYEVVGVDLSLAMLARAGEEAQERDAKLNFVQGDMRELAFEEQFDGVYCWNTSFGYFEEEKNAQVIAGIHRALKAGGLFLLDVVNRDFLIRQSPSLAWFEGDGCVCMDDMSVDFITSRMKIKRTMMLDDGRTREIEYSIRVYSLHELGKILHEQGFKVSEVSGRIQTPGVFFGNESSRTMILAEKR